MVQTLVRTAGGGEGEGGREVDSVQTEAAAHPHGSGPGKDNRGGIAK